MSSAESSAESLAGSLAGSPAGEPGLLTPVWTGSAVEAATGDIAVLRAMLDAEAALARAQAALGVVPGAAADVVCEAADVRLYDVRDIASRARSGGNPAIPLVADLTAAVARRSPEAAPYVHLGATSQDIVDTALMLVASRALPLIIDDLGRAADALARLAAEHRDTVLPGRTLTQHAVPTTFGLKAAGWRALVLDAMDRLSRVVLPAQLGGAAGTLAAFQEYAFQEYAFQEYAVQEHAGNGTGDGSAQGPAERAVEGEKGGAAECAALALLRGFAAETGLAEPPLPWHVLRTPVADLGAALAFTAAALGKMAADVLVLSRTEIGEVAEGAGGGSSAMPHKSNPVRATLVAAVARQAPALAAVLLGCLSAEDERPPGAWHAEWPALRELLRLAGGAATSAAELAEGLRVHPGRMRANLDRTGGLLLAERLAVALTPLMGRAEARATVERASRRSAAEEIGLAEALRDERLPFTEEELRRLLDPATYVGPAPALTDRALRRQPQVKE
ncbi:lyase family protein [Microtetraspora sp. NBRC 16547]|uniref:lyase family protein n=1 Tax=Microtetraspora sp. NBRC 16547 TaxID=3030993 RepID=UPI00249FB1EF|nr:lyase family protein [Microtetraspora sp. NBRC 16547]GLX01688.1 3-carboxy-cis,cis-muconate cycloisomerase [Microtetraspora sp. NBRC 16547]